MAFHSVLLAILLTLVPSLPLSAQESPSNDAIFAFDNPDGAWWVHAINLPAAWQLTRGSPDVVIAIVDDGVQLDHEEFVGRIVKPASYFNDTGEMIEEDFFDDTFQTHGTPVASVAVANADNGAGTVGVCPNCSMMPVQTRVVLGPMTVGSVLWGLIHAMRSGAKIINLSAESGEYGDLREAFYDPATRTRAIEGLIQGRAEYLDIYYSESGGHDLQNLSLLDIFDIAEQFGVLIVVGAGNSAIPGAFNAICYHAFTLCVGSITRRDDRSLAPSNISNYGFMVQVSAPGEYIYVARFDSEASNGYAWERGTSLAAPMVAGLAGLIRSEHPDLKPADLRKIIIASARPLTPDAGHATGVYAAGTRIETEMAAWRRAFLRLLGRDENLLLDGPAMQVLVNLIPHADNTVWLQSQAPRSAGTLCAALDWDADTQLAAMERDDCAKYVGPVIDAARALALAQSGKWKSMFADFDESELEAARNIDPAALVALAQELGAVQP